ncbi:hypothetical protein GlitD10_2972 [Gloeomargarita lithophora Alchichica-D10]|uniref:Uncharacterized protein n=2 Tax=Gloeomargarita TaxID=1188227 RepID=A0A1J0AHB2_9CYAN|nr:hypothetical protein GlitD10_2972 [Gloeomargarita lithophora Alchichica-D10]
MYCLDGDGYVLANYSRYFPEVNLSALVAQVLQTAASAGTGAALRELRQELL